MCKEPDIDVTGKQENVQEWLIMLGLRGRANNMDLVEWSLACERCSGSSIARTARGGLVLCTFV
jgi:hypothetical protein